jgi:ribose transport system substrate-binding protein
MALRARTLTVMTLATSLALTLAACSGGSGGDNASGSSKSGKYVLGVSNTLVGNGWREEMICAVKAQALASGKVSKVVSTNRNGGPTEQIADLRSLISQGVNAIIVDPSDGTKLNDVIDEAKAKGITVVSVDSQVTDKNAYNVTNDQEKYGRLGGEALAKLLDGKGNVVEMRGAAGVPADTDRHKGFTEALQKYPNIKIVKQTFTGWDNTVGGQQALDVLNGSQKVDGIWTSGIDYTVVNAFDTLHMTPVPVIGADNNAFVGMLLNDPKVKGAAVSNPAAVGGVGAAIALQVLEGKKVDRNTLLTPEVWTKRDTDQLKAHYFAQKDPTYSTSVQVKPYTTYTNDQLFACKGPGE